MFDSTQNSERSWGPPDYKTFIPENEIFAGKHPQTKEPLFEPIGLKYDDGKPPLGLIDYTAQVGLANVLAYGAKKYNEHNWRLGLSYSRIYNAVLRHLGAFIDGEDLDPESGLPHVDHAQFGLMVLSNFSKLRPDLDDRYKNGKV